jgi:hypothetical protein
MPSPLKASPKPKHDPTEPIRINEYLVFGCRNENEARWAYHETKQLQPYYPNGFPQLILNYNRKRQLTVKPAN